MNTYLIIKTNSDYTQWCRNVYAWSWEDAETFCDIGEVVFGKVEQEIQVNELPLLQLN